MKKGTLLVIGAIVVIAFLYFQAQPQTVWRTATGTTLEQCQATFKGPGCYSDCFVTDYTLNTCLDGCGLTPPPIGDIVYFNDYPDYRECNLITDSTDICAMGCFGIEVTSQCNTNADTNCNGCIDDFEILHALNNWVQQTGISDTEIITILGGWVIQGGC